MPAPVQLSADEARVIGALIEKELSTPDQYPLSVNALVNACNQKNNRDPIVSMSEASVLAVLETLSRRRLVMSESGSRVTKYKHRFCNTEFGSLKFSPQELAIVCELLLRGAQMPGDLRSRASRFAAFKDVAELERVLEELSRRGDGPFVVRLAREPGRRESRYMHLFSGEIAAAPADDAPRAPSLPAAEEIARLEAEVDALRDEVAELLGVVARIRRALT